MINLRCFQNGKKKNVKQKDPFFFSLTVDSFILRRKNKKQGT